MRSAPKGRPWATTAAKAVAATLAIALVACARRTPMPSPNPSASSSPIVSSPPPSATNAATVRAQSVTPIVDGAVDGRGTPSPVAVRPATTQARPPATPAAGGAVATRQPPIGLARTGGEIGGTYRLEDVRTGRHDGFIRFVWAMAQAKGAPRWATVLRANDDGSAVIDVALSDVTAFDAPQALAAQSVDDPIARRVRLVPSMDDALLRFAIELTRPVDYTVTSLEDPVRIVIDVANEP